MPSPLTFSCQSFSAYIEREVSRLQKSIESLIKGLDPGTLLEDLEKSITEDVASTSTLLSNAASQGIESEFTQKIIQSSIQSILREIGTFSPEAATIASRTEAFVNTGFSMIQILLSLTENSPLVMAGRAYDLLFRLFQERDEIFAKILKRANEIKAALARIQAYPESVREKWSGSVSTAAGFLDDAISHMGIVEESVLKQTYAPRAIDLTSESIKRAIYALSPSQEALGDPSAATLDDVVFLLKANVEEKQILEAIQRARSINAYEDTSDATGKLANAGGSPAIQRAYQDAARAPKKRTPLEVDMHAMLTACLALNEEVTSLSRKEGDILRIAQHYFDINAAMEAPLSSASSLRTWHHQSAQKIKAELVRIRGEMRTSGVARQGISESWVARLSAAHGALLFLKKFFLSERKSRLGRVDNIYYASYKASLEAMKRNTYQFDNAVNRTAYLTSNEIIQICTRFTEGIRSIFSGTETNRESLSLWTDKMVASVAPLAQKIEEQKKFAQSFKQSLSVFSQRPQTPALFASMDKLLQAMGLDRLRDQFLEGGLKAVQEMVPSVATYGGAALQCLQKLKLEVESEAQRASIDKAILLVEKQERRRQQGNVQITLRSKKAIEHAKRKIEEWISLSEAIFKQIPAALAVPTQVVHAAHAGLSEIKPPNLQTPIGNKVA